MDKKYFADVTFICVVFVAALAMSQAWGDFPLNDDWSYTRMLKNWYDGNPLQISGWSAVTLVAQLWWGRLFCDLFGFSFNIVRLSTVFLSLLGLIAFYGLLRQSQMSRRASVLAALVLAFSPFYFVLTPGFMTEVPFTSVILLALYFGARYLTREKWLDLLLLIFFSTISVLIRQTGLVVPLGFAMVCIIKRRSLRRSFGPVLAPFFISVMALAIYYLWLKHLGVPKHGFIYLFANNSSFWNEGILLQFMVIRKQVFLILIYTFLMALPWLLFIGFELKRSTVLFAALAAMLSITLFLWWQESLMPAKGNVLYDFGLGPILLRDVAISGMPHHPSLGLVFRLPLTFLAAAGLVLGMILFWRQRTDIFASPIRLWALLIGVLYALPFVVTIYFIDRTMILFLPLSMIILADAKKSNQGFIWGAAILIVFALFSLAGTHDYFAWNRARWQALTDLMQKENIPSTEIDGGFEFNGWHHYRVPYKKQKGKSWWWVENDTYQIAMGPRPGYDLFRIYSYQRWLVPGTGSIYVLKKSDQFGNLGGTAR